MFYDYNIISKLIYSFKIIKLLNTNIYENIHQLSICSNFAEIFLDKLHFRDNCMDDAGLACNYVLK